MRQRNWVLERQKYKPGSAVQRFGEWTRKPEIQVLIYNQKWLELGKPDKVEVEIASDNTLYSEILGPPHPPIGG